MFSDDHTLKPDSPLRRWSELLLEGFTAIGRPLNTALKYKEQLTTAGFVDLVETREKWPQNGWPRDRRYKQIGEPSSFASMPSKKKKYVERGVTDCFLVWNRAVGL